MTHRSQRHDEAHEAQIVQLITSYQRDIYVYARSLVVNPDDASEIVQDTNLVLWEKRDELEAIDNLRAWIFQIVRYKVLEYRTRHKRKCVPFSNDLLEQLASHAPQHVTMNDDLIHELRRCVAQLSAKDRNILNQRYSKLISCENIADVTGRPIRWVYNTLNRIRQNLLDCVTRQVRERNEQ